MGQRGSFKCSSCGYSEMIGGGKQIGMESIQWTIRCYDCAELLDVFVSDAPWDRSNDWTPTEYSCPENEAHRVALWSAGDGCPKCDGAMEAEEGGGWMMWD